MIFSENLAKLRKEKGLSQEELAELCSVSRQAVTKWEAGTSQPDLNKIALLAKTFDISLDELILGAESIVKEDRDALTDKIVAVNMSWVIDRLGNPKNPENMAERIRDVQDYIRDCMIDRFSDEDGNVRKKYSINTTTKEQRIKNVKMIIGYDAELERNPEEFELYLPYIEGKLELRELYNKYRYQ